MEWKMSLLPCVNSLPKRKSVRSAFCVVLMLSLLLVTNSTSALNINFNDITGMTPDMMELFELAAADWESRFTDPVTVNIDVGYGILDWDVIMYTRASRTSHSYVLVRLAMQIDAMHNLTEAAVVNQLLMTTYIRVKTISGDRPSFGVTMTTANAKALGLATPLDNDYPPISSGADAEILFNALFALQFDFDPTDGIDPYKKDFVGMITHEIGHALGFMSSTDVQDLNPDHSLHPHTLDLFRFSETRSVHDLNAEGRRIKYSAAEYYDTVRNNIPFSQGILDTADPACTMDSCQASHWSDDQQNLMDPTAPDGVMMLMTEDDVHAIDYIGWNRDQILTYPLDSVQIGWMLVHELDDVPEFDGWFDNFAPLPDANLMYPPPDANLAFRVGLDLGFEGGHNRSGLGYARFDPCTPIEPNMVDSLPPQTGEEYLDPPGPAATHIPPRLSGVYIISDYKGVPFTFQCNCGKGGCPFDPTLGDYGGFRVPGFIYGQGDKIMGDVDALLTLILLADASGKPMPAQHNIFSTYNEYQDNNIIIYDAKAIGAILPPRCGDDQHPRPKADLDGNCIVDFRDFSKFADEWLICTAPLCQ